MLEPESEMPNERAFLSHQCGSTRMRRSGPQRRLFVQEFCFYVVNHLQGLAALVSISVGSCRFRWPSTNCL